MYNEKIPVTAAADLSAKQYMAVGADGNIAGTVIAAIGVLDNKPQSGEGASLIYSGRAHCRAGGAVTAGATIGVSSTGYFVAVNSGVLQCGKALTAVGSGGVFDAIVNFAVVGG